MAEERAEKSALKREEKVRERVDAKGIKWCKIYFGGGSHFQNWLAQTIELCGEENVKVEEVDAKGFRCFEEGGQKMHRIWVKEARDKK